MPNLPGHVMVCAALSLIIGVILQAAPTRDPNTPGFVTAKELPDGTNAPADADGDFIIGRTHHPSPELQAQPGAPQGAVYEFTMSSSDSKIYPGIARDPGTHGVVDLQEVPVDVDSAVGVDPQEVEIVGGVVDD